LVIGVSDEGTGGSSAWGVFVEPGAEFHRSSNRPSGDFWNACLTGTKEQPPGNCWAEGIMPVVLKGSHGNLVVVPLTDEAAEGCS
jgi:hypothetical protein